MEYTNAFGVGPTRGAIANQPASPRWSVLSVSMVIAFIAAACSGGGTSTDPSDSTASNNDPVEAPELDGALTIRAQARFNGETVVGTFVVKDGADVLGCELGTFEDFAPGPLGIDRSFTCDSGDRSGTILVRFDFGQPSDQGDLDGPWEVQGATGDFVGLSGSGDFSATTSGGMESFVGEISYDN